MRNGKALAKQREEGIERLDPPSGMDTALLAAQAALDKKAEDPALIDLRDLSGVADYFLLLSGSSDRHVSTIADEVIARLKRDLGVRPIGVEGTESSQWVLIDVGDVLIHVFQEGARAFYDLDGLWPDAPRREIPGAPPPVPGDW